MPEPRALPCKLTPQELETKARSLADKVEEWVAQDEVRKTTAREFKDRLDAIDAEIRALAHVVSTGSEDRQVAVIERRVFERGVVEVARADTGDVVDFRPMTPEERQGELFGQTEGPVRDAIDDAISRAAEEPPPGADGKKSKRGRKKGAAPEPPEASAP